MPRRPCLDCGRLTHASRCERCAAVHQARIEQRRGSATHRGYGYRYRVTAAAKVSAHRQVYGDWCPGYGVPAHRSADLTADHITPKSAGGADTPENLAVLCRMCNARKYNRIA
ncbi:HNH endonuclease [Actinacidiphila acididurans]|uniref:HNH endonuclease n=1 Tax=Actinacidiphila acididurans TaxID=2784346 RepID=A0ABS2TQI3_9ACTN|nr:HNH endonuclease signature motif containing protein [Actinacidiphila acididurans]MBM9504530.1 HNH endonuclease [Actinacidiphila acididurans]